jgi:hypothetical protein
MGQEQGALHSQSLRIPSGYTSEQENNTEEMDAAAPGCPTWYGQMICVPIDASQPLMLPGIEIFQGGYKGLIRWIVITRG